jgi:hypothetical protein
MFDTRDQRLRITQTLQEPYNIAIEIEDGTTAYLIERTPDGARSLLLVPSLKHRAQ